MKGLFYTGISIFFIGTIIRYSIALEYIKDCEEDKKTNKVRLEIYANHVGDSLFKVVILRKKPKGIYWEDVGSFDKWKEADSLRNLLIKSKVPESEKEFRLLAR